MQACQVVATDDIEAAAANSPINLGKVEPLSREDLTWKLTVQQDGHLPWDGLIPVFVEWPEGPHPSAHMQELGITLRKVRLSHPDRAARAKVLVGLGVEHLARVSSGAQGLFFVFDSPGEEVVLDEGPRVMAVRFEPGIRQGSGQPQGQHSCKFRIDAEVHEHPNERLAIGIFHTQGSGHESAWQQHRVADPSHNRAPGVGLVPLHR